MTDIKKLLEDAYAVDEDGTMSDLGLVPTGHKNVKVDKEEEENE